MAAQRLAAAARFVPRQEFRNLQKMVAKEIPVDEGLDKMAAKIHENYQLRTGRGTVTNRTELALITELKRDILFEMLTPRV